MTKDWTEVGKGDKMAASDYDERFSRLHLLLHDEGLDRLQAARVMVLGLGGVGSSCAEALARGGIGHLMLVDRDIIEASNINRQALAFTSTIGRSKTSVMEAMVHAINPDCKVMTAQTFLNQENIESVLSGFPRPDYVIDCIDTISPKLMVAQWCMEHELPLLASMGGGNKLDPIFLKFDLIENTRYCPLSKAMRRECRRRGIGQLEVLYTDEEPVMIDHQASSLKHETLGTMSYFPPIMGQMLAGKVIRRLVGFESYSIRPVPISRG